jgi:hypothetical protein
MSNHLAFIDIAVELLLGVLSMWQEDFLDLILQTKTEFFCRSQGP